MKQLFIISFILVGCITLIAQSHPNLILTKQGVKDIKTGGTAPLFDKALAEAKAEIAQSLKVGIQVPIPKDAGGGYTHEQHKRNYKYMNLAGNLYQITGEKMYANYVKKMLTEYVAMYKDLPLHPVDKSYSRGKLFWQCLNEANWLVYTSQAYDAVYDCLSAKERKNFEDNLFRPFADFLSIENPKFFNRIHNHSTWGNAAVGMIGLVMKDEELINRALYGLSLSEQENLAKDNDGGFIYEKGQSKAGFLAQIDHAFSPDGYYTEGPYYQRYAMTPFMLFSLALHHNKEDLKIFEYRDGILLKAVYTLLYQTNQAGEFFPINDAMKGMSIGSGSVISAVNIAYGLNEDPELLSVAKLQSHVLLDHNGYAVARALQEGKAKPFFKKSVELRDGAKGDEGALGILRTLKDEDEIAVLFKYAAQGLGHGHFDKLSYSMYDGNTEVLQDYGSARWVNIDHKAGGRYLKENKSWAKQTIAHNTLVVDGKSHFAGKYEKANTFHSEPYFFNVDNANIQIISAKETNAYEDVAMQRTLILCNGDDFSGPILIDVMAAFSENEHQYELPFHYAEHFMRLNAELKSNLPKIMGEKHGYQHLYQEASSVIDGENLQFTWFRDNKMYSITAHADTGDEAIIARIGANDPNFNLRRDALLIHRKNKAKDALFLSLIEPHGSYSPVTETPDTPYSQIKSVQVILYNKEYTIFTIKDIHNTGHTFMLSNENNDSDSTHKIEHEGNVYEWKGTFKMNYK